MLTGPGLMLHRPARRRDRQRAERKARWRDRQRRAGGVMKSRRYIVAGLGCLRKSNAQI